jgi:hypothetical protein
MSKIHRINEEIELAWGNIVRYDMNEEEDVEDGGSMPELDVPFENYIPTSAPNNEAPDGV